MIYIKFYETSLNEKLFSKFSKKGNNKMTMSIRFFLSCGLFSVHEFTAPGHIFHKFLSCRSLSCIRPVWYKDICHDCITFKTKLAVWLKWMTYFQNFKFVRVCSLVGRYFYNMHIVRKFEVMFSFNVKNKNIFPCLHDIRLSYNI